MRAIAIAHCAPLASRPRIHPLGRERACASRWSQATASSNRARGASVIDVDAVRARAGWLRAGEPRWQRTMNDDRRSGCSRTQGSRRERAGRIRFCRPGERGAQSVNNQ